MIFIGTYETLEIGKVHIDPYGYITTVDSNGKINKNFNVRFLVIRKATFEEWLKQQLEKNPEFKPKDKSPTANFYQISID